MLIAAGAGAGLATAFNAPIAGAVFVLEELVRRFEPRMAIAALAASTGCDLRVAHAVRRCAGLPCRSRWRSPAPPRSRFTVALGAVAGLLAVGYNRALLGAIAAANDLRRWPLELRAGAIGAAVGALAWFAPDLVGGGDPLTQRALNGGGTLAVLPLILLLRFGLGAVSYAAGTPGGLFAPLLVIGAQLGLCFGLLCRMAFPGLGIAPQGFAVVGMAAFFTGVVRAPLTGIMLVVEMTANVTDAAADAGGMLRGHAGADPAAQCRPSTTRCGSKACDATAPAEPEPRGITWCGEFEVPAIAAASLSRNFKSKDRTRT